ncbi:MAG: ATP-binding protein [Deltaproteobacteria bacterium]
MSKKKVAAIIELAARADWGSADEIAATLERAFLQRRLELESGRAEGNRAKHALSALEHFGFTAKLSTRTAPDNPPAAESAASPGISGSAAAVPSARVLSMPADIVLDKAHAFLQRLDPDEGNVVRLDDIHFIQPWAIVALAVLARAEQASSLIVAEADSSTGRFARALGLFDVAEGREVAWQGDAGRTVLVQRFSSFEGIESTASKISKMVLGDPETEDTRKAIYYVLVELLRNVVQHSRDPLGGVVGAQLMNERQGYKRPTVQVTVGDAGIGVFEALKRMHPTLSGPQEGLEKALWPHYSGTFEEGRTGAGQNAGLGLFFIAEMAKLVGGRLLLASRGAAIQFWVDPDNWEKHTLEVLSPSGVGFPGTLVTFELPLDSFQDYEGLIGTIQDRARERTPNRVLHRWVQFVDVLPADVHRIKVTVGAEDTVAAKELSDRIVEKVFRKIPMALDFSGLSICTQSYLHALLFETVRTAWARQTPLYVVGAKPGVKSGVELLENYALGG